MNQKLYYRYDKRQKDFTADTKLPRYGNADLYYIMDAFAGVDDEDGLTILQQLEKRGYDVTTIRFSIEKEAIK